MTVMTVNIAINVVIDMVMTLNTGNNVVIDLMMVMKMVITVNT
jgi:hypothetical protein